MTHLLSFLLFIHFFHTEYPLLIETSLLRSYVLFFFFLLLSLLFIFIYGGLHNQSLALEFMKDQLGFLVIKILCGDSFIHK
jgi:hypothetical protein